MLTSSWFSFWIRLSNVYLRVSSNHPEKQTICREPFSWATKKFDMSSKSIKKDQNENWAPTIRGVFFCPSSSVVVTDFFRVPCFKTGIAGRKRPASRNHDHTTHQSDYMSGKVKRVEIWQKSSWNILTKLMFWAKTLFNDFQNLFCGLCEHFQGMCMPSWNISSLQ